MVLLGLWQAVGDYRLMQRSFWDTLRLQQLKHDAGEEAESFCSTGTLGWIPTLTGLMVEPEEVHFNRHVRHERIDDAFVGQNDCAHPLQEAQHTTAIIRC